MVLVLCILVSTDREPCGPDCSRQKSALQDSDLLNALLSVTEAALSVQDESGIIRFANRPFCRLFGIEADPEEMTGRPADSLAAHIAALTASPSAFLERTAALVSSHAPLRDEEIRLRDGRVLLRDSVPASGAGGVCGHLWRYRDATVPEDSSQANPAYNDLLSMARVELARVMKMRDEFLAVMSHELRTPLNAVLGLSEALRAGIFGKISPEQDEPLAGIEENGRQLLLLINDILDLSKVETGHMELSFTEVELNTICSSSLKTVAETAQNKNIKIEFRQDAAVPTVLGDSQRLKQILVNLLSNAVKFTPDGGSVGLEVTGNHAQDSVTFTVWDTGIGIAPQDMLRIFQPFVQLDTGLARRFAGTGLGLTLVRRLAELHGGGVEVQSTPRRGSRFAVTLPRGRKADAVAPSARSGSAGLPGADSTPGEGPAAQATAPLVVVAHNSAFQAQIITACLAGYGFRTAVAHSGAGLLETIQHESPALLLINLQTTGIDGPEIISRLHKAAATAQIPVIALASLTVPGDPERCREAGAIEYFREPVHLKALAEAIARLLI